MAKTNDLFMITSDIVNVIKKIERLLDRRRFKQAYSIINLALKEHSTSIDLLFLNFKASFGLKLYYQSESSARKILRIDKNQQNARLNLGAALHKQGRITTAIKWYREEIAHFPESLPAHYNLGITLARCNNWKRAYPHLLRCIGDVDTDDEFERLTARCAFVVGDYEVEAKIYENRLKIDLSDAWALNNRAALYMGSGEFRKALILLYRAQIITPFDAVVLRNINRCERFENKNIKNK
jgi:tetratricopeptide (TPR) repeat protein